MTSVSFEQVLAKESKLKKKSHAQINNGRRMTLWRFCQKRVTASHIITRNMSNRVHKKVGVRFLKTIATAASRGVVVKRT